MAKLALREATEAELAYAAGYFDAGGFIGVIQTKGRRGFPCPVVWIETMWGDVVKVLHQRYGGALRVKDRAHEPIAKHNRYSWRLYGASAYNFMVDIEPYLKLKRRRAQLIIQLREIQLPTIARKCRRHDPYTLEQAQSIAQELRLTYQRGGNGYGGAVPVRR